MEILVFLPETTDSFTFTVTAGQSRADMLYVYTNEEN